MQPVSSRQRRGNAREYLIPSLTVLARIIPTTAPFPIYASYNIGNQPIALPEYQLQ